MIHKRHSDHMKHLGIVFILSSPSGAGKTTVSNALIQREKYLHMSVSVTTRPPRQGEVDGEHYYFQTKENFEHMIAQDELLEYAKVFENHYGTLKSHVMTFLDNGYDVLLDIDWQGAQQLRQKIKDRIISVFILPPSLETLEDRLSKRAQDSPSVIEMRMSRARDEMNHWAEYDYVIINDDLEKSVLDVQSILRSERLRRRRQIGLDEFVQKIGRKK